MNAAHIIESLGASVSLIDGKLKLAGLPHEVFVCLQLDAQHRVIAIEELFRGTLTQTSVYPREVVKAEELVDYTRRENVAERLAKRFGAALGEGSVRALTHIPAIR